MITKASQLGAVIAAAATLSALVSCGSTTTDSTSSTSQAASTAATTIATEPPRTEQPPPATDGTVVEVLIAGGTVTPTNGQAQATVGKPIVLQVTSDVADQLHVHSVPEHTFNVEPRPDQTFEFTVDVPGQVDIELHDLNRSVVTIQVRP
ncbi:MULTISPECIES: hypothetical protein [Mycolicibacterium]|jgi:hypothetical protein|uniref:hypothetical protein n=1 Tax=Mycobacteriaceae TaxID=1762 RepID=UPI001CA31E56|nr:MULTISPECIES: hypothetical protein [Mycolicibacterium]QZT60897.1 hypothetical protein JN085_17945 [Mycolicibacterium austroafricanum]WND60239.1 hypothetical protein QQA43_32165 [Mycolicibacterium vanbaalenii]